MYLFIYFLAFFYSLIIFNFLIFLKNAGGVPSTTMANWCIHRDNNLRVRPPRLYPKERDVQTGVFCVKALRASFLPHRFGTLNQ